MPSLFPDDPEVTQAVAKAETRAEFDATRYRGEPKPEPTKQRKLFEDSHWHCDERSLFGE